MRLFTVSPTPNHLFKETLICLLADHIGSNKVIKLSLLVYKIQYLANSSSSELTAIR